MAMTGFTTMNMFRSLAMAFTLALAMAVSAQSHTLTDQLGRVTDTIETLASDNGLGMKVTCVVNAPKLIILAEMTDEEDNIDYIAGYLSHADTLTMLAPVLTPLLEDGTVTEVTGRITDRNGQCLEINLTAKEIIAAAKR